MRSSTAALLVAAGVGAWWLTRPKVTVLRSLGDLGMIAPRPNSNDLRNPYQAAQRRLQEAEQKKADLAASRSQVAVDWAKANPTVATIDRTGTVVSKTSGAPIATTAPKANIAPPPPKTSIDQTAPPKASVAPIAPPRWDPSQGAGAKDIRQRSVAQDMEVLANKVADMLGASEGDPALVEHVRSFLVGG